VTLNVTHLLLADNHSPQIKRRLTRNHHIHHLTITNEEIEEEEEEEEANHESLFIHGPSRKGKSLNV
jgi:hypothetical protein